LLHRVPQRPEALRAQAAQSDTEKERGEAYPSLALWLMVRDGMD